MLKYILGVIHGAWLSLLGINIWYHFQFDNLVVILILSGAAILFVTGVAAEL